MPSSGRCAACKSLRRRCPQDCVFSPYFPATHPQRFSSVHKIYGASNVGKMLQQIPVHLRAEAADSMFYEASSRIQDPVYGCVGIISHLQHQIQVFQRELAQIRAQISFYEARQANFTPPQLQHVQTSSFSGNQQDPFHELNQPLPLPDLYQPPEFQFRRS